MDSHSLAIHADRQEVGPCRFVIFQTAIHGESRSMCQPWSFFR